MGTLSASMMRSMAAGLSLAARVRRAMVASSVSSPKRAWRRICSGAFEPSDSALCRRSFPGLPAPLPVQGLDVDAVRGVRRRDALLERPIPLGLRVGLENALGDSRGDPLEDGLGVEGVVHVIHLLLVELDHDVTRRHARLVEVLVVQERLDGDVLAARDAAEAGAGDAVPVVVVITGVWR